jgi:hypothetical protein
MSVSTLVLIAIAAVIAFAAYRVMGTWIRFRGARVITCPENRKPAGVQLDARHAAATGLSSTPELRLSECSRWPEKQDCGRECLRDIRQSPEGCLVRNILLQWYAGKSCALCGNPIGTVGIAEAKPALLSGDKTLEWSEVAPERLHEVLASASPVCFGCHAATAFAHQHPELVIRRSRPT